MNNEQLELWQRLEGWSPDLAEAAFPFSKRLARDNGWPAPYAVRVLREYKRFVFLAVEAGHPVTPSDQVDQAWHLHLLYTRSYWSEFCGQVLGRPLHHGPTQGGPRERDKFNDWYGLTLASYRRFFCEEPPAEIWPAAERRFGEDIQFARVNTARNWVLPKPAWVRSAGHWFSKVRSRVEEGFETLRWPWTNPFPKAFPGSTGLRSKQPAGAAGSRAGFPVLPSGHKPVVRDDLRGATSWKMVGIAVATLALAGCGAGSDRMLAAIWPFNLPAEPFLIFYVTAAVVVFVLAWRMRENGRGAVGGSGMPTAEMDPYEIAYLAAGRNRALLTAIASLADRGVVEIDANEHKVRRREDAEDAHEFEKIVQDAIGTESGCTYGDLAKTERVELALLSLEQRLGEDKLTLTDWHWARACLMPGLLALTVPAVGMTKVVIGLSRDHPAGVVLALTLIGLAIALAFFVRPHRTHRGDAALQRLQEEHRDLNDCPFAESSPMWPNLPLAVGLFGAGVLANTPLADIEAKLRARDGCGAGGCGGGDGGGGGGCGGCGGCG